MILAGYILAILTGLSLRLIGGGGSILTVPILVYFFGIDAVTASSYSLFVVGIASLTGTVNAFSQKEIAYTQVFLFGIPSLLFVFLMRKVIMPLIPEVINLNIFSISKGRLVLIVFAILMIVAAYLMIKVKEHEATAVNYKANATVIILQGVAVGIITGFVGVGGGFLIIPALIFFSRLNMKKAVGTSLVIITLNAIIGVIGDLSNHVNIDLQLLLVFAGFAVAGIIIGGFVSKYIHDSKLKPAFGWFVFCIGLFILTESLI